MTPNSDDDRDDGSLDAVDRAVERHRSVWGDPALVVRAPGRVNLIGEHTDYNDGYALPMALPFDTVVALSPTGDASNGPVEIDSAGFGTATIDPAADPRTALSWARHIAGVVSLLRDRGVPTGGWRAVIDTDVPTGASLSSSAALQVAIITAMLARDGRAWPPIDVALLGQQVENEVIGLPSGIMDQFISAGAVAGHASLMDCRAQTLSPTPLPPGVVIAILDTGTRRVLAEVEYGERRASCERAVAALGVAALRDATAAQVESLPDDTDRRRARHVVAENERTLAAARAMESGDVIELGRLMSASHVSLRDDYAVSGPGLDAMVDVALASPGCLGARMTGGGFAGCAVALVRASEVGGFVEQITEQYSYQDERARVWACLPSAGAAVVAR